MKIIGEEIKDLSDLKQNVINLKKDFKSISENLEAIKSKKVKKNDTIGNDKLDYDINKDGKISPIEIMLVKTIQAIASKQQDTSAKNQHTSLWMLISTLLFLALLVILQAFGMQVSL